MNSNVYNTNSIHKIVNLIHIKSTTPNFTELSPIQINFTDNEANLSFNGTKYLGGKHIDIGDITDAINLNKPSYTLNLLRQEVLQVNCTLQDTDLLKNKEVSLVKYDVINNRQIFLHCGTITGITDTQEDIISIDVGSKLDLLNINLSEQYSPICRANFCDKRCGLNMKDFIFKCNIERIIDANNIAINCSVSEYHEIHIDGFLGLDITQIDGNILTINNNRNYRFQLGAKAILSKVCDKRIETCAQKYNNALNFRGEPHINDTISFVL